MELSPAHDSRVSNELERRPARTLDTTSPRLPTPATGIFGQMLPELSDAEDACDRQPSRTPSLCQHSSILSPLSGLHGSESPPTWLDPLAWPRKAGESSELATPWGGSISNLLHAPNEIEDPQQDD